MTLKVHHYLCTAISSISLDSIGGMYSQIILSSSLEKPEEKKSHMYQEKNVIVIRETIFYRGTFMCIVYIIHLSVHTHTMEKAKHKQKITPLMNPIMLSININFAVRIGEKVRLIEV